MNDSLLSILSFPAQVTRDGIVAGVLAASAITGLFYTQLWESRQPKVDICVRVTAVSQHDPHRDVFFPSASSCLVSTDTLFSPLEDMTVDTCPQIGAHVHYTIRKNFPGSGAPYRVLKSTVIPPDSFNQRFR